MFAIYVNRPTGVESGYLAKTGSVTPEQSRAATWPTLDAANREIASRGWLNDTSVRLGRVTAYACQVSP